MGRVAVDFGGDRGAKRGADIRSDLDQASNEGQRKIDATLEGVEAEGQLAASLCDVRRPAGPWLQRFVF